MLISTYDNFTLLKQEQIIINEIDFYNKVMNEGLIDNVKDKIKKLIVRILNYFTKVKKISKKMLDKVADFLSNILKKLSPDKKEQADKELNMIIDHISRVISGNVDKETSEKAVKSALEQSIKEGLIDNNDIKKSFEKNKDEIIKLIYSNISAELDNAKKEILQSLDDVDKQVSKNSNILKRFSLFATGTITMLIFGIIDNLGLFVGMNGVESWVVQHGGDAITAAGIGNAFSDAVGALLGGAVMALVVLITKRKGEGTTAQQVIGVTVGCLIPVFAKVLFSML